MSEGADIIEVEGLSKSFGDFKAVDDISFRVKAGEIFAFLGPNGAGKTTTIKMLTTLLNPSQGRIRLDGHDAAVDKEAVRRSFGIVFQDPSLDDELSAWENMELHAVLYGVPAAQLRARVEEMLGFVDLLGRKDSPVKTFSGGMKRRLEIARGLLHHPKVLFLDEPTVGLDPQTRNHIWEYIQQLNRKEGITVFLTTHYMDEADRVANRVAIIDHGKILVQETPQALKASTGTASLEEAFIHLTGHGIRHEEASSTDQMRKMRRMWRR
ncbi:MAG TPA: ATP-binding cassette domain-containing protein [bacterium]|jgi:ABC-2 type transport system ATP-binding protein|nr:ATP-binding cassette domain-containing protein [bacterium]